MTESTVTRDEPSYLRRAEGIPCDEQLLEPLGRVLWAAIRLHHVTRDCLEILDPHPTKPHFEQTLGGAIRHLKKKSAVLPGKQKNPIEKWCDETGLRAAEARDGVAHATGYTATDGRQAIGGSNPTRARRYQERELLVIAGMLDAANLDLSRMYNDVIRHIHIEPVAIEGAA